MKLTLEKLKHIYFCTGARNHDLLQYFDSKITTFEYDERMASFKALGLTKSSETPVAVCTTSGTAVSECLSAMLEALYSKSPLVLITGDRPKKQHGTGAPQTINHETLTQGARGSYFEVDLKSFAEFEIDDPVYPVHINVLIDDTASHQAMVVKHSSIAPFEEMLKLHSRPLFLFSHEEKSMREFVNKFADLKLPFYAESMSGAHDLSPIKTEKELIRLFKANTFDCVIRVGFTPLSKIWRLMESKFLPVANFDSRGLPALSYGDVYSMSSRELMKNNDWWKTIQQFRSSPSVDHSFSDLKKLMDQYPKAEISTFHHLQKALPAKGHIYLGNSLIIRNFELTQTKEFQIHGSRGVNGIDGQLATAIGLASGLKETVYCILGDITTKYDLSSLQEMPQNLKLIIINNKGGRIFDMLKLDKRIVLEHEHNFQKITTAMGLKYAQDDLGSLERVQVLELFPDRGQSELLWKEWST